MQLHVSPVKVFASQGPVHGATCAHACICKRQTQHAHRLSRVSSAELSGSSSPRRCQRNNERALLGLHTERETLRFHQLVCSAGSAQDASVTSSLADAAQPGFIFGRGSAQAWDSAGVGSPVVRCYVGDNEQRWFMWYCGRSAACPAVDAVAPSSGSVGVAVSSDGVTWSRGADDVTGEWGADAAPDVGKTLGPNQDWWTHDTCHMTVSDVQIMSNGAVGQGVGVYWMYYSGGDFEAVPTPPGIAGLPDGTPMEGLRMRPGLAMSQDGRNWARIEAEHHTGALFDVGPAGAWDSLLIASPQVLAVGPGDMRMYYHSFDPTSRRWTVGLARSADGFKWTKVGPIFAGGPPGDDSAFDAAGVMARHVVQDPVAKRFVMYYEAVALDGHKSIGLAVSSDGLTKWRRYERPVLQQASDDSSWDSGGVGAPCAVAMAGGKWRLYYAGRRSADAGQPWEAMGLALTADDSEQFEGVSVAYKRRSPAANEG